MEPAPDFEPHHAGGLAPVSASLYMPASERKRTDNGCTVAFLVLMAFSVIGGVAVMSQGSKASHGSELRTDRFYNYSMSCNPDTFYTSVTKPFPPPLGLSPPPADSETISKDKTEVIGALAWILITIVIGIPASLLYLNLFKRHPRAMVRISLFGTLALLGVMTIVCLAVAWPLGILMLIWFLILAVATWIVRNQLDLCAELLGVASHALTENLRIIPVTLGISFASLGIIVYLFSSFMLATNIGQVTVPQGVSRVPSDPTDPTNDSGICFMPGTFQQVNCCNWTMDAWPTFYIVVCWVTVMWTAFVVMQIKLHIVADLIAQWYYQPAGAFSNDKQAPSIKLAVKNALTNGFGTAVFAGGILFLIACLRKAMRMRARNNLLCAVINCFVQPLLAILEKFTQFASIAAAITGKPFIQAAKDMFEALKRCLFKTDSVWWVPNLVIGVVVYAMSLVWCAVPFLAMAVETKDWGAAFVVALICFIIMVIILQLTAGLLMDIVNTLYCCFALDRDAKTMTRQEVHQIYNQVIALTSPDAVIQNPGGEFAYGRAEEGRAPGALSQPAAPSPYNSYRHENDTQPLMGQPHAAPMYSGQQPAAYTTPVYPGQYSAAAPTYGK